jgi:hypothetical protein
MLKLLLKCARYVKCYGELALGRRPDSLEGAIDYCVDRPILMYSPLVRPGGIVAFHDIVTYKQDSGCEVAKFWNEIKPHYRHLELVEGLNHGSLPIAVTGASMETAGLGVLFMP